MERMRIRPYRPSGVDGGVGIGLEMGPLVVGAVGADAPAALNAAAGLAQQLLESPEVRVLLPPQAQAALTGLRIAAAAARRGRLEDAAAIAPAAVSVLRRLLGAL